ncbi:hypothetical protein N9C96_01605 [bacterium]|nr:hypothetical protein [bacterium]
MTRRTFRYLSHPQVVIDPLKDVQSWSRNDLGKRRVACLAKSGALTGTKVVIGSAETKAIETATLLAEALGCTFDQSAGGGGYFTFHDLQSKPAHGWQKIEHLRAAP